MLVSEPGLIVRSVQGLRTARSMVPSGQQILQRLPSVLRLGVLCEPLIGRESFVALGSVLEAQSPRGWLSAQKSMELPVAHAAGAPGASVLAQSAVCGEKEPRLSTEPTGPESDSGGMPLVELVVSATPWRRST